MLCELDCPPELDKGFKTLLMIQVRPWTLMMLIMWILVRDSME